MAKTYRSFALRNELFFATAAVAAHSTFSPDGFRQRDLKFYAELFSNWVEVSFDQFSLSMQNTQLSRFLELIVKEGFAQRVKRGSLPRYRLTRVGLIELLRRCVSKDYTSKPTQFFFLYFFISNYKSRIWNLILREGREFPDALRIELETVLDQNKLLGNQLVYTNKAIQRIQARVDDGKNIVSHIRKKAGLSSSIAELVLDIQKLFPYELNNQKPFTDLIREIPEDQKGWEILEGTRLRSNQIFEPTLRLLIKFADELDKLKSQ
jgi:hypothetical protein